MEELKEPAPKNSSRWAEPSDELLRQLRSQHPEGVYSWELEGVGTVVWRVPSRPTWFSFMDRTNQPEANRSEVIGELVDSCLLYPSLIEYKAALDELPGIMGQISREIQITATVAAKKAPKRL